MRRKQKDELIHTAYHEAGHTVVASVLGLKVDRTSIKRRDFKTYTLAGYTNLHHYYTTRRFDKLCVVMAGMLLATHEAFGDLHGGSGDVEIMTAILACLGNTETERDCIRNRATKRALKLVRANIHKIDRVAYSLLEQEVLNKAQIKQLVEG